jgi:hypothetical protein
MFSMCSQRIFPIIPHFYPIWFAQSSFLLSYIGGPNRSDYIFTRKLLFWGPSEVSKTYLLVVLFFFVHDGPIKMAYWTQKRKVKRKGIWETPPHLFNKIMILCCVLY